MRSRTVVVRRVACGAALLAAGAGLVLALPGCGGGSPDDGWPADKAGPKVVVSFAPLYCFALNVAGDDATVRNLLANGGPHHFNPTDRDAKLLRRADLFLVNGLGLEGDKPGRAKKASGNTNLRIADLGGRIPEKCLFEGSCHHDHEDGDDHPHDHGKDPHVWLGPDTAVFLVEGIRDELKAADPAHAADYDRRAGEYVAKLRKLKADGVEKLKDKKDRRIVTFHDSMTYFAHDFGLNIVGVVQKTPGTEPNARELERLIALCAGDRPVRVVCVEPQYGNSRAGQELVKTLRQKGVADAVLVELDPLETAAPDQLNAGWYEARMRANLDALAGALR